LVVSLIFVSSLGSKIKGVDNGIFFVAMSAEVTAAGDDDNILVYVP
jgi:hypothetical protein